MILNLPEAIYKVADFLIIPLVKALVPHEVVERRLESEQSHFDQDWKEYSAFTLSTIHERASSMVSHLSLMLGVCLFIMQSKQLNQNSIENYIVTVDALLYIMLVILSVRGLRSFGLDHDRTLDEYKIHIREELILRYCIMQIVNSLTIVATVFLVVALLLHLWT